MNGQKQDLIYTERRKLMTISHIHEKQYIKNCSDCNIDITNLGYPYWGKCQFCYWNGKINQYPKLDELLTYRSNLRKGLNPAEVKRDKFLTYLNKCKEKREKVSFIKRFFGYHKYDKLCFTLHKKANEASLIYNRIKSDIATNENLIKSLKKAKKEFSLANICRYSHEERINIIAQNKKLFLEKTQDNLYTNVFDRNLFIIRQRDYKRGNLVDNFFRNEISSKIINAFENQCLKCGSVHDLTLDHFAIPKNEGGNFILFTKDTSSIKLNIVVLCRSCNASKGERNFMSYFDYHELSKAIEHQEKLLEFLLECNKCLQIIQKWYKPSIFNQSNVFEVL